MCKRCENYKEIKNYLQEMRKHVESEKKGCHGGAAFWFCDGYLDALSDLDNFIKKICDNESKSTK